MKLKEVLRSIPHDQEIEIHTFKKTIKNGKAGEILKKSKIKQIEKTAEVIGIRAKNETIQLHIWL